MSRSQVRVNTSPVADTYASRPEEKIIEFSSPNGGGLIGFRVMDDGTLRVDVYRQDPTVRVLVGDPS